MKKNYIFVLLMMLIVFAFASYKHQPTVTETKDREKNVALVPCKGLIVVSENPVKVDDSGRAVFEIKLEEDYTYADIFKGDCEGMTLEGNRLIFTGITSSCNIYYSPRRQAVIKYSASAHGTVELLTEERPIVNDEVIFKIVPDEHYYVDSINLNGEVYPEPAGDTFTCKAFECTELYVEFAAEEKTFMAMSTNAGSVVILNDISDFRYNDVIYVAVDYNPLDARFLGWSMGGYLEDGGELYSLEEKLEYCLLEDTILYANVMAASTFNLSFDANGGEIQKNYDKTELSPGVYINLPVTDIAARDGYVLSGFNTSKEGDGTHYSLGSLYEVTKGDKTLFAEWIKCTDPELLSYVIENNSIKITGYKSEEAKKNNELLCIPAEINGLKVATIGAYAFNGNTALKTVVVPVGVTTVGTGAFAGCSELELIYLPETVAVMPQDAFSNTAKLTHMRVLASLGRALDYDYDSIMADKHMMLKNTPGKRIILVAGSSCSFGYNSEVIMEAFPDYTVVNFGNSFLYGINALFEMLKANVHEGDIVVFSPEFYSVMYGAQESGGSVNWNYLESDYNILDELDLRNCREILNSYMTYLNLKRSYLPGKLKNSDSTYVRSGINKYGDLIIARANKSNPSPEIPWPELVTEGGMKKYNALFKYLTEKGASCVFSFAPQSHGGYSKDVLNAKAEPFMQRLRAAINPEYCTIISQYGDYCFSPGYCYDKNYHLTLEGAAVRSRQLVEDLKKWGGVN